MTSKPRSGKLPRPMCAELSAEDGADPRWFLDRRSSPRGSRKALQLCRQVERALGYTFAACDDPVLSDLFVELVEPAPDASHLLITVSSTTPLITAPEVLAHLHEACGHIRAEIAASIHRRRVPELTFCCVLGSRP